MSRFLQRWVSSSLASCSVRGRAWPAPLHTCRRCRPSIIVDTTCSKHTCQCMHPIRNVSRLSTLWPAWPVSVRVCLYHSEIIPIRKPLSHRGQQTDLLVFPTDQSKNSQIVAKNQSKPKSTRQLCSTTLNREIEKQC